MNKTTKIVLILLGILILSGIMFKSNGSLPLAISGTSTLSISQASLQSSNPQLNGKAWLINFVPSSLGQRYYGTFSPEQIDSATSDNSKTTKPLSIEVQYSDTTCNYPLSSGNTVTPIYDLQYKTWTCFLPPSQADATSKSGLNKLIFYGRYGGTDLLTCYAVGYNTLAVVKSLPSNPNIGSTFTINIDAGGNKASQTFNTLSGQTSGSIGSFAYANWNGNLVSGQACPFNSIDYKGAYVSGNWRIISSNNYNNYVNSFNSQSSLSNSKSATEYWFNDVTSKINTAKTSLSATSNLQNSQNIDSAVYSITTQSPIQFPVTSLYIKADTLGIYTPSPNCQITSTSSSCFKTGDQGSISVNIVNNGETGGCNVFAKCSGVFSSTQNVQVSLNSGQSRKVYIPISATATKKELSSCTVSVQSAGTSTTKTTNSNVCVDPQITCLVPYPQKFCKNVNGIDQIRQCSSDGATETLIQSCSSTEYCDAITSTCKATSTGITTPGFLDKIKSFFAGLFSGTLGLLTYIKYFIIVVASLISGFMVFDKLKEISSLRKNNGLRGIIAIAIALGIAYLLYLFIGSFLFWVILVLIIAFYVIKGALI